MGASAQVRITGGRNTDGSCTLTERRTDIRMWVLVGHSGKKESPQTPNFQSPILVTYFVCIILSERELIFSHYYSAVQRKLEVFILK